MAENLRDLDITKDELDRIGEALKKKEFRDMLVEYCEELNDPATKKQYEEEIVQLEKERGIDVTFVNPIPGYVIKTSVDGNKLAFINVSSNEHVDKPVSKSSTQDGSRGLQWSLPHLISPPREDMNKKGLKCTVYDVIFHPDTMQMTSNTQFRDMVNKIACEAVESNFNVVLDKTNLKFPNLKYKGAGKAIVIRKKSRTLEKLENDNETDSDIDKVYSNLYKQMDNHYDHTKYKSTQTKSQQNQFKSDYVAPKYIIKHRSDLDIQDFTYERVKSNGAIPKELIIEINLPLLKSSADLILDVSEKSLKMVSEKPSKYKLEIALPYTIDEEAGNAKFDVDHRKLILTLPVKRNCNLLLSDIGRYDSGVDSDTSPLADSPRDKSLPLIEELQSEDSAVESQCSLVQSDHDVFRTTEKSGFLSPDLHYSLPEYSLHVFDNILCFTLHVKNVDADSIKKEYNESSTAMHIKFSSISSGYFPVNYAFFVYFPLHQVDTTDVSIEPWDNNVIVQIPYQLCDTQLSTYFVGTCDETLVEKLVEEPSIISSKQVEHLTETSNADSKPNVEVHLNSEDELTIVVNPDEQDATAESMNTNDIPERTQQSATCAKHINIKSRSLSESSYEELSRSHSPSRSGKSILKTRFGVSRSMSESSVDDFTWSSFENCGATSESLIPEESEDGEISSSMKKTVRFNDVVSKQVFRSNSSILGQRKKNQRKSRNKKRAYERKLSESENSEAEDKKNSKSQDADEHSDKSNDKIDFKSDLIFDLDM